MSPTRFRCAKPLTIIIIFSLSLIYKDDYSPPLYQLSYGECELNIQSTDTALIDHSAKLTTIIDWMIDYYIRVMIE